MPRSRLAIALPAGLVCFLGIAAARPALSPQDQAPQQPQASAEHKKLLIGVGEWKGTLKSFVPGMGEQEMPASQTVVSIGGFWVRTHFKCTFMGQPYIGSGHTGYDPKKKKFVGTWVDNMSSHFSLMEGERDAKGQLVMKWKAPDMTGTVQQHRSETTQTKDRLVMHFFMGEGKGTKTMTIDLKRVAKKAEGEPGKR